MDEQHYLRELAKELKEIGQDPIQMEKARIVKACNQLKPERPVIFARPENGWDDLHAKWGPQKCRDPFLKKLEDPILKAIIRHKYIDDDMPVLAEARIPLRIQNNTYNDFGVLLEVEESESVDKGAYHITPALQEWSDMKKLHFRPLGLDRAGSQEDFERAQDLLGDLLDVHQVGVKDWRYGQTRVLIHMRGFNQFLIDFYDYPDQTKALMAFLNDNFLHEIAYYRQEGIISPNTEINDYIGVGGPCYTDELAKRKDRRFVDLKDCCVWAESQETVGVSAEMFDEFVFTYQKPLAEPFGLTGYGCCESLDAKFEIIKKGLPNLRWVAVTPWADKEKMADQIGKDYVYLCKVQPSYVVQQDPEWKSAENEVKQIFKCAGDLALQFSLKDTNTFCKEPERITRWVAMVKKEIGL